MVQFIIVQRTTPPIQSSAHLSAQAPSQRSAGSATLRPTACQVLVVSVNLGSRGTARPAVQSHVSVFHFTTRVITLIVRQAAAVVAAPHEQVLGRFLFQLPSVLCEFLR